MKQSPAKDLPEGWVWKTLGEICKTTSGGTPSRRIQRYFEGEIPWVKSGELPDGIVNDIEEFITEEALESSSAKLFPPGTLLIALYGATVGKLGLLNKVAATNQAVCAIFPAENLFIKYLFWYLRYMRNDLMSYAVGGAQPNISQGILRGLVIPLAPRDQQHLIVAEIEKQFSRLDEAVAGLKRIKANLKRYKAAVLKAAVEGKLTEEWRKKNVGADLCVCPDAPDKTLHKGQTRRFAPTKNTHTESGAELLKRILAERKKKWEEKNPGKKYKEPIAPNTSNLPDLPEGWVWASADQCTSLITDGEHITPTRSASGIFLLSARNVLDGSLSLTDVDYISEQVYKKLSQRFIAEKGDVLLSCSGSVGRSCVVPQNIKFAMVRSVAILKPLLNMGSFLSYSIRSLLLQGQIEEKKTQTAQANIFQGKIRALAFPIPPLNEQKVIVEEIDSRLSLDEEIEEAVAANFRRIERLRQSILAKAFSVSITL